MDDRRRTGWRAKRQARRRRRLLAAVAQAQPPEAHRGYGLGFAGPDGDGCDVDLDLVSRTDVAGYTVEGDQFVHCGWVSSLESIVPATSLFGGDSLTRSWPPRRSWPFEYKDSGACGGCFQSWSANWFDSAPPGEYGARHDLTLKLWGGNSWTSYPPECSVTSTTPYPTLKCTWYQYVTGTL